MYRNMLSAVKSILNCLTCLVIMCDDQILSFLFRLLRDVGTRSLLTYNCNLSLALYRTIVLPVVPLFFITEVPDRRFRSDVFITTAWYCNVSGAYVVNVNKMLVVKRVVLVIYLSNCYSIIKVVNA